MAEARAPPQAPSRLLREAGEVLARRRLGGRARAGEAGGGGGRGRRSASACYSHAGGARRGGRRAAGTAAAAGPAGEAEAPLARALPPPTASSRARVRRWG